MKSQKHCTKKGARLKKSEMMVTEAVEGTKDVNDTAEVIKSLGIQIRTSERNMIT